MRLPVTTFLPFHLVLGGLWLASASLTASDCNGNGKEDAADIASGASVDCNENGTPDDCELAPLVYVARGPSLPTGDQPHAAVTGDLDGDGRLDLAVANFGSDDVSVLLGSEEEGFGSSARLAVGKSPADLVLSDLNGDGRLDLAIANSGSHEVALLQGLGNGTFSDPTTYPCGNNPQAIDVADFNGDGLPDIAVTNRTTDSITVLENQGAGVLGPGEPHGVGDAPRALVAGDFDGDGAVDLASANVGANTVSVLRNLGSGTFGSSSQVDVGRAPTFLVGGDLDGDEDIDLATSDFGSKTVSVLVHAAQGAFQPSVRLRTPGNGRELTIADIDGDGDGDIVATYVATPEGSTAFFRNNGNATFHEAENRLILLAPSAISAADFNLDGYPELILASESEDLVLIVSRAEEEEVSLSQHTITADLPPHCMALGDFDGDGDPDIATGNGGTGEVVVFLNDGHGEFPAHRQSSPDKYLVRMAAGDLDGDGDLDLVSGYVELVVLLNDGKGIFADPKSTLGATATAGLALSDLDGDGALDIESGEGNLRSIALYKNDGKGAFGDVSHVQLDRAIVSFTAADFDGDDRPELTIAHEAGAISILKNEGNGTFAKARTFSGPASSTGITAADMDADGDLDLVTTSTFFRNEGDAVFRPVGGFPGDEQAVFITTAEVNGDGRIDVIVAKETPGSVSIILNKGGSAFGVPTTLRIGLGMRAVLAGDLDADGDADLATADRGGRTVTVLRNDTSLSPQYLERICTDADFNAVSIPSAGSGEAERAGKFLAPATDRPDLLPVLFQNVHRYPLHQEFLAEVFPERFPALGADEYLDLTGRRASRQYFTGAITLLRTAQGPLYGFSVYADPSQRSELLTAPETKALHDSLLASFHLEPFAYYPDTRSAAELAGTWATPGFPIYFGGAPKLSFQAYTHGINFGRVRLLTAQAFAEANAAGLLGWQDVLVLAEAPRDIEGVVAGVITAEPQGVLSHLSVRTARRGTPNAYLENALETLKSFDGKLVRIEVREAEYVLREAELPEAESWWASHRPKLSEPPLLDTEYSKLDSLAEVDLSPGAAPESRFGGKATNFARMQRVLEGPFARYKAPGFVIPVHYYLEFMRSNRIASAIEPAREVTYEEYIHELLASQRFQSDSSFRFESLERFREEAGANGVVGDGLVRSLALRIADVFGATRTMVRFRSSSNVEDALEFNGAGLYESTSACAADDLDSDESGPSRCDSKKSKERNIADALRFVWASLWTFRGHEERAYYQVPEDLIGMAVLVSQAFDSERANGVAFTGNPSSPADRRYVVNVQLGEKSVVSPEPGETPEVNALELKDGRVTKIARIRRSALAPDGFVLADPELEELGELLWHLDHTLPIELGDHPRSDVLLDVEFKFDDDSGLAIKQVRPFLTAPPEPPGPTFELVIPESAFACGGFVVGRDLAQEYALKSRVRFKPGRIPLPTSGQDFEAELVEEVTVGPEQARATPGGPGVFRVERVATGGGRTTYRFEYEQDWSLEGGASFQLKLFGLTFRAENGEAQELSRTLDDSFWTENVSLEGGPVGNDGRFIVYGRCVMEDLPLWLVSADLKDDVRLQLEERMLPSVTSTGPANLVRAVVQTPAETIEITDYHDLVYSAFRHNQAPRYRIVLPRAVSLAEISRPVKAIELHSPEPTLGIQAAARFLDIDFKLIVQRSVLSFRRELATGVPSAAFERGDFDGSGKVDIADAIDTLSYLFRSGAEPGCRKAADSNDDGKINVTDAVSILLHLVAGRGPLPPPFDACGADPTEDSLDCDRFSPCP